MPRSLNLLLLPLATIAIIVAVSCSPRDDAADPTPTTTVTATATIPPPDGTPTPSPGNGDPAPQALPPNLQQMLEDVAALRGLPAPPALDAYVIHRSELTETLDGLLTNDDMQWFHNTTTLYRLLGHFRDDQDYYSIYQSFGAGSILGFYAPDRDALWVVTDGDPSGGFDNLTASELETLAHEFLHAIQDYNFDLDETYYSIVDSLDRELAWTAIVEGDAVIHESLYSQRYLTRAFAGRLFLLADADANAAVDVPASIVRELYMPYTTGADTVQRFIQAQGIGAIDQLLANPPGGTSLILHPELLDAGWAPEPVDLPTISDALGPGWQHESGGSLGEFHLHNYLRLDLSSRQAMSAAEGWAGDRYDVYVDGRESVALFRVRFTTAEEAAEFEQAHDAFLDARTSAQAADGNLRILELSTGKTIVLLPRQGREVLFAIGSSGAAARVAVGALAEQ